MNSYEKIKTSIELIVEHPNEVLDLLFAIRPDVVLKKLKAIQEKLDEK